MLHLTETVWTMKLLFLLSLILAMQIQRQQLSRFEDAVLLLCGAGTLEELSEDEWERYRYLADHPLDLNACTRSAMLSSGLFSPFQAASLLDRRMRDGDILSYTELGYTDGFTPELARALSHFVVLRSRNPPGKPSVPQLHVSLLLRTSCSGSSSVPAARAALQTAAAHSTSGANSTASGKNPSAATSSSASGKNPSAVTSSFASGKNPSAATSSSASGKNDPFSGSAAFGIKTAISLEGRLDAFWSARKSYSDRTFGPGTISLAIYGKSIPGRILLGDYSARFGQGLLLWSGFSIAGFSSVQSFRRNASGLSASSSFTRTLHGIGLDLALGRRPISAVWSTPVQSTNPRLLALNYNHIFRTSSTGATLLADPGRLYAASIDFRAGLPRLSLSGEFAFELLPAPAPAALAPASASASVAASAAVPSLAAPAVAASATASAALVTAPAAVPSLAAPAVAASASVAPVSAASATPQPDSPAAIFVPAGLLSAVWTPSYGNRLAVLARYYPQNWSQLAASPPSTFSTAKDEFGSAFLFQSARYTLSLDLARRLSEANWQYRLLASANLPFRLGLPGRTQRKTNSSTGIDGTISVRSLSRFRPSQSLPFRQDLRCDLKLELNRLKLNTRCNLLWCRNFAMLGYIEPGFSDQSFSLWFRLTGYSVPSWDDRISTWERDIPGSFTVPARYGKGLALSCTSSLTIQRKRLRHRLNARLSYDVYSRKETLTRKPELKLQYRMDF